MHYSLLLSWIIAVAFFSFKAGERISKAKQEVIVTVSDNGHTEISINKECVEKARKWCEYQISLNNHQEGFFQFSIDKMAKNDISWKSGEPYGLHYSNVIVFARAWDNKS